MKLVEVQIIRKSNQHYKGLMDLLHKSKNLYNVAVYTVRQFYFDAVKNESDKNIYVIMIHGNYFHILKMQITMHYLVLFLNKF